MHGKTTPPSNLLLFLLRALSIRVPSKDIIMQVTQSLRPPRRTFAIPTDGERMKEVHRSNGPNIFTSNLLDEFHDTARFGFRASHLNVSILGDLVPVQDEWDFPSLHFLDTEAERAVRALELSLVASSHPAVSAPEVKLG